MGLIATAILASVPVESGAGNDTDDSTYLHAAIEMWRDHILAVPGSGEIRGLGMLGTTRYAWRDNAAGTACVIHKNSSNGWEEVDLGKKIDFTSGGTVEITEDATITGATSLATATVERIVVSSGTWGGGDAAGYIVLADQGGTFIGENLNIGTDLNVATVAGDSEAITLLPGGHYEIISHNFFGQPGSLRMYGCDGVNQGFEFDGSVYCPITTGLPTDTPTHVSAHKKHLFFMFPGGSTKHSGVGYPLKWLSAAGALEIALGDVGVGMAPQPGGVLAMWCRNSSHLLYGNDATDWELKTHSEVSGAIEWTIQRLSQSIYLDDPGVTTLNAVQDFGDFGSGIISQDINPLIKEKNGLAISSMRVRDKQQYRLFFSDNSGLSFTFNSGKLLGVTRTDYGMPVRVTASGEISGSEVLLFGSDDGYVYQLDKGTSLDGEELESMFRLPYNHLKTPENKKAWYKAVLELSSPEQITLEWIEDYDYSGGPSAAAQDIDIISGGGYWNISNWNEFLWSSQAVGTAEAYLGGVGNNMGLFIRHASVYDQPHSIQGMTIHYSVRGLRR